MVAVLASQHHSIINENENKTNKSLYVLNMIRILALDDDHSRLDLFKKLCKGHDLTCVETAQEAIDAIEATEIELAEYDDTEYCYETRIGFDIIFLDHDLGGQVYVQSGKGTGYEVIEYLCNLQPVLQRGITIVVHSFNPAGAANMMAILEKHNIYAIRAPIGSVEFYNIIEQLNDSNRKR